MVKLAPLHLQSSPRVTPGLKLLKPSFGLIRVGLDPEPPGTREISIFAA